MITLSRRKLIGGLASLIAAPAIVKVAKVANIMPVKAIEVAVDPHLNFITATEVEELKAAQIEEMVRILAAQREIMRQGIKRWWEGAYTEAMANNYIGVGDPVRFIENPLLPAPNHPIAQPIG